MFGKTLSQRVGRAVKLGVNVGAVCLMLSSVASAQSWNKKTTVKFSEPVKIPGVGAQVLPPGTYVFKLLDSQADRHIVQVFNEDQTHIYVTILAIPNYRLKATDKTVMTFSERSAGEPQAIRAWFYPGDNWGQEFTYPKKRAVELAKVANVPVLYIPDEVAPNIVAPVETASAPPVIALKEAPVMAVKPSGEIVPLAAVVAAPPVKAAGLPKTASELPFAALIGVLLLGLGFSFQMLCKR